MVLRLPDFPRYLDRLAGTRPGTAGPAISASRQPSHPFPPPCDPFLPASSSQPPKVALSHRISVGLQGRVFPPMHPRHFFLHILSCRINRCSLPSALTLISPDGINYGSPAPRTATDSSRRF